MAKLSVYSFLCAIVALHGLVGAYQNYKFQKLTPQFRMAKRPLSQTSMMMSPGLSSFVMSDLDVVTSAAGNSLPEFLPSLELSDISATPVAIALGSAFLLFKTFVYWRMQFVSASMVSGIPKGSSVVEIDAQDGKNVFYLPQKVDYTAVMSTGGSGDAKKEKEKSAINNQLILESIGKANRGGLGLSGKVRSRTQDVPSKTADCVLSVGAISRAGDSRVELVNEAFRILKPGGLLVFVEPDGGGRTLSAIQSVFPEKITSAVSAGQKAAKRAAKEKERTASKSKDNSKSKSKRRVKSSAASTENVSNFAAEDLEVTADSNTDSEGEGEGMEGKAENENSDVESSGEEEKEKAVTRPGLTFEVISNVFDPYVTGIAVRP